MSDTQQQHQPVRKRARRQPPNDYHALALDLNAHAPRPHGWATLAPASPSTMPVLDPAMRARFIWAADDHITPQPQPQPGSSRSARAGSSTASTARSSSAKKSSQARSHSKKETGYESSDVEVVAVKSIILRNQCHSCRRNLTFTMMRCRSTTDGNVCPAYFCRRCIQSDYRGSIKWDPDSRSFHCPKCLGFCKCPDCATARSSTGDHLLNGRSYEASRAKANHHSSSKHARNGSHHDGDNDDDDDDDDDDDIFAIAKDWDFSSSPKKAGGSNNNNSKQSNTPRRRIKNFGWSRTGSKNEAIVIPDDDENDVEWLTGGNTAASPRKPVSAPRKRKIRPAQPSASMLPPLSERGQSKHTATTTTMMVNSSYSSSASPAKSDRRTPTTFWRSGSEVDPATVAAANKASHQDALRRQQQQQKTSLKVRIKRPSTGVFSSAAATASALMRKSVSPLAPSELSLLESGSSSSLTAVGRGAAASPSVSSSTLIDAERNVWVKSRADFSSTDEDSEFDGDVGHVGRVTSFMRRAGSVEDRVVKRDGSGEEVEELSESERRWQQFSMSIDAEERKALPRHWKHALDVHPHHHHHVTKANNSSALVFGHGVPERSAHKMEDLGQHDEEELLAPVPGLGLGHWYVDRREEALQIGIIGGISGSGSGSAAGMGCVVASEADENEMEVEMEVAPPAVTEAEQLQIAAVKVEEADSAAAAAAAAAALNTDGEGGGEVAGDLTVPGPHHLLPDVDMVEFAAARAGGDVYESVTSIEGGMAVIEGNGSGNGKGHGHGIVRSSSGHGHGHGSGGAEGAKDAEGKKTLEGGGGGGLRTPSLFDPAHTSVAPELRKMSVDGSGLGLGLGLGVGSSSNSNGSGNGNGAIKAMNAANLSLLLSAAPVIDDDAEVSLLKIVSAAAAAAEKDGEGGPLPLSMQGLVGGADGEGAAATGARDGGGRGRGDDGKDDDPELPSRGSRRPSVEVAGEDDEDEDDDPDSNALEGVSGGRPHHHHRHRDADPILREFESFANFDAFVMPSVSVHQLRLSARGGGSGSGGSGGVPVPAHALSVPDLQGYFSDVSVGSRKRSGRGSSVEVEGEEERGERGRGREVASVATLEREREPEREREQGSSAMGTVSAALNTGTLSLSPSPSEEGSEDDPFFAGMADEPSALATDADHS